MRNKLILAVGTALAFQGAIASEAEDKADLSYMLGYDVGTRLTQMDVDLDADAFMQAVRDVIAGKESSVSAERLAEVRDAFNHQQQAVMAKKQEERRIELAAAAEANVKKGQDFLAENAKRDEVTVTESGLQYEVIEMGEGAKPSAEDRVTVHYEGRLINGEVFDSSMSRGQPATFGLNGVISGWTEGLQLMPVGSKFKFVIPADLAYGGRSMGELIGPNSTLVFDVELLEIEG